MTMSKVVYELVDGVLKPVYWRGVDRADVPVLPLEDGSLVAECVRRKTKIVFTPTFDQVSRELSGVRVEFE